MTGRGFWKIDGGARDSGNPVARGAQEKPKKFLAVLGPERGFSFSEESNSSRRTSPKGSS
jgi:16S rRNA U1498 N3-methylase RsmE